MGVRLGADAESSDPAWLKANDVTFISRYHSDFPSKNLTPEEAQRILASGLDLVSNWENDTNDYLGGYNAGFRNANVASAQQSACGGPGNAIYFSVDTDANPADVADYFRGVCAAIGVARSGVYASTAICRYLKQQGLVTYTWRTMSTGWSGGVGDPSEFNVEQTGYLAGSNGQYDRDASITDDFGQWRVGQVPASHPTPVPTPMEDDLPTPADVWGYRGTDRNGAPDTPDVHQSLLDCRDGVADLKAKVGEDVWGYKNPQAGDTVDMRQRLVDLEDLVAKIARHLGV